MKLSQLAENPGPMPEKVQKPSQSAKEKTEKGAWGGGNNFYQAKSDEEFTKLKPRKNHKQKLNVKP
jgi:hypothetical protein